VAFVLTAALLVSGPVDADEYFTTPEGPRHAVALYVGQSSPSNFTTIVFAPWRTKFEDITLVNLTYSYRALTVLPGLDMELEVGVGQRFGNNGATEIHAETLLRWTRFPWNDHVRTTFGLALFGPSYTTSISHTEERKSGNDGSNMTLNFFGPEITVGLPDGSFELLARLHHRSGVFGLIDGVSGGSTYVSIGARVRF
jgi:hypothetical protein